MISAYLTGALVMAWHLWTRRARHVRRGWKSAGFFAETAVGVALWPIVIIEDLLKL